MFIGMNLFIVLFILVALMVLTICLQIFLAKKESKWLGLILPLSSFLFSLFLVFLIGSDSEIEQGEVLGRMVMTFVVINIPTIILLGIYYGCQSKRKGEKRGDGKNEV